MGADTFSEPAVIDLGLERGEPDSYHRPARRTTPRRLGPAVVALLVLLGVAGSVPAPDPVVLTAVLRVPIGPGDPFTIAEGGRLVAQSGGTLSAYHLRDGELRWQVRQGTPVYRLRTASGLLLLRPWAPGGRESGTSAISLATGATRWHHARNVVAFPGTSLLFGVRGVRSSSGIGRRVEESVQVVDPVAGTPLWQVRVPSTAVLLSVPGVADTPARMLLVRDDRTAHLYDVGTGRYLAGRALPPADYNPENPVVAGGAVLLRHPGPSGTELSAFDQETLQPMWTEPAPGLVEVRACGRLACLIGPDGVRGVETATGDVRWHQPGWTTVQQLGTRLVAYAAANDAVALVDPGTGQVQVDLGGWQPVAGTARSGELLVTRDVGPGARTMVAIAAPGSRKPRLLAELPEGTGDCQAAPDRLVCRSSYDELVVWAYQPA